MHNTSHDPHIQQLDAFITSHRNSGTPDHAIYGQLLDAGWDPNLVNRRLELVTMPVPRPPAHVLATYAELVQPPQRQEDHSRHTPKEGAKPKPGMFAGRLSRRGFLLALFYSLSPLMAGALITFVLMLLDAGDIAVIVNLIAVPLAIGGILLVIITAFGAQTRRLHDLGRSGWWQLIGYIPPLGLVTLVYLLFWPGDKQANSYGAPLRDFSFLGILGLKK